MSTNRVLAIILILVGGYLVALGISRSQSVVGHFDSAMTNVENSANGGTAVPKHAYYLAGGAVLIVVGVVMAVRRTGGG